ncbi:MAG: DUF4112 domain-containing protein [Prevotella sp.]|nr:DUF4112 domain-containing protein [Prevotella sp.]
MNRELMNQRLEKSRSYKWLQEIADVMDKYYIDAALGFAIPGGIGDAVAGVVSVAYIAFSMLKVRSLPLTLAIINNTLRDILLGMIPFYIGDVIDVLHKSNRQNMNLIKGFVDGDEATIRTVNKKAAWSAAVLVVLCTLIFFMVKLLINIGSAFIEQIGH